MTAPLPETVALILHFRDDARTSACLDSIACERVGRALLVDNSDDQAVSLGALLEQKDRWRRKGLLVTAVDAGRNLGFSAGVNLGLREIARAHGRACVLLINSDATLGAGSHAALRSGLQSGLQVAGAWMSCPDGSRIGSAYYQPFGALVTMRPVPGAFRYLSACCLLLSPGIAAQPLLDEDFFFYGEDIELGWRLAAGGVAYAPVPLAVVEHEGSAASGKGSLFYEYHMARAHVILPRKLARGRLGRWAMYACRIAFLPLRATLRSARSASLVPWKGLVFAVADLVWGRTRSIQPGRR